jgi:predicted RNA binding protein YcfA (HicA-like mRNA interferase family)
VLCLQALLRIGWSIKRQSGSHRTLARDGWPDYVFAFHDGEEIDPCMLSRVAKYTGLSPSDLQLRCQMKVREVGEDESEQRVIDDVAKFGWHCINIHPEGDEVGYAFTVGLFASYGHPGLIIFGLQSQTAHAILSIAARAAKDGAPLNLDQSTDALLEGYSCCFGQVSREEYREHVGYCRWFYYGNNFPLYQVIWPSRSGLFPWHPEATDEFRTAQPIIASRAYGN